MSAELDVSIWRSPGRLLPGNHVAVTFTQGDRQPMVLDGIVESVSLNTLRVKIALDSVEAE